jgi:hypothetical protein
MNVGVVLLVAAGALLLFDLMSSNASAAPNLTQGGVIDPLSGTPMPPSPMRAVGLLAPVISSVVSAIGGGGAAAAAGGGAAASGGGAGAAGGIGAGGAALVGGMGAAFVIQFAHVLTSPTPEETRIKLDSTSFGAFVLQFGDYEVRDPRILAGFDMSVPSKAAWACLYQRLIDSGVPWVATGSLPTPSWIDYSGGQIPAADGKPTLSNYQYALARGFNLFVNKRDNGEAFVRAQQAVIDVIGAGQTIAPLPQERDIFRTKGAFGF